MIWKHLDLFSGIGGFALATEMVWPEVEHTFCEIDPYAQAVLRKHWPDAIIHEDIKKLTGGGPVDLVTGGFPCQPWSGSGQRRGTSDDRHLWPEMLRVIRQIRPRWIIGENVDGLVTWNDGVVLESILNDLGGAQYQAQCFVIPAAAVAAPHRRDRIWIVAHADSIGSQAGHGEENRSAEKERLADSNDPSGRSAQMADSDGLYGKGRHLEESQRRSRPGRPAGLRRGTAGRPAQWPAEPAVGRVGHGIPARVDRIKALGNAIVPQVAAEIMRAIKEADDAL